MTSSAKPSDAALKRLGFLCRVIEKQVRYLHSTDIRLFADPLDVAKLSHLAESPDLAERVDAFVGRLGRLQDTLADKLLPAMLGAFGEPVASHLDNLDRAEKLTWIDSAEEWYILRQLRNQMIHEYIEDTTVLADALRAGHAAVPKLIAAADAMRNALTTRRWI